MRVYVVGILVLIVHVIQTVFCQWIEIGQITPNIMIMIIVAFALLRGSKEGALIGAGAGFLYDITLHVGTMGLTTCVYALIGYLCGKFNRDFYRENFIIPFLCTLVSSLINGFLQTIPFLLTKPIDMLYFFKSFIIPELIYTITLSLIVYEAAYLLNEKIEKHEKKTRNIFE